MLASRLNGSVTNLAQSGASEYLITSQVEEAVKKKPDLIVIGHTSEFRWQVWDFRRNQWQGFLVANHVLKNEKYYRNWILSEQILGNTRKKTAEHQAAWHAAGMLYFSNEELIQRFYRNWFWILLVFLIFSIYDSRVKAREIEHIKYELLICEKNG